MTKEHFLPFDLESVFSSAFVLMIASVILPTSICSQQVLVGERSYKDAAFSILDDMIYRGSAPAKHRKADLEHLNSMIESLLREEQLPNPTRQLMTEASNSRTGPQPVDDSPSSAIPSSSMAENNSAGWQLSGNNNVGSLYPAQMDSIAQALGSYNDNAGANLDDLSIDQWLWNYMST